MGKLVVQTVDALDHQHVVLPEGQEIAVILPCALLEIERGHFHRLAVQEAHHVRVELLHVHGPQALEVVVAVFVLGGLVPVDKVVVRGDGVGPQAAGPQLGGQPVGEGGLAGGGRPGDHDEADLLPGGDLGGDVADLLLHHGLVGQDQGGGAALGDGGVELGHVGGVQRLKALVGAVELPEYLVGGPEVPQLIGIFLGGQAQDEAVLKQLQAKALDIAGIGRHVAVEVIHKAVQRVDVDMGVDPEAEQLGLVDEPLPLEQLDGVVNIDGMFSMGSAWADSSRIRSSTRSSRARSRVKSPWARIKRARLREYSTQMRSTFSRPATS